MPTKTMVVSRNNWVLTIERPEDNQQFNLSLIDNFGIPQKIHRLVVFNNSESSAEQLQDKLLKLLHSSSKKDYQLQIYQHNNLTTVVYGPYGLFGGGKNIVVWSARLVSAVGIASGCAFIIIAGMPSGKILIDASTDLLFHTFTEEEMSVTSCAKATFKGAAISIATLGIMTGMSKLSKVVKGVNKVKEVTELAIQPSRLVKFGSIITKQTAITLSQKAVAEIVHSGVEGCLTYRRDVEEFSHWKEQIRAKYRPENIAKIFYQQLVISIVANSIAYFVESELSSKYGLYDLRTKHSLRKLGKNRARIVGKGIDTALQSFVRALTEEGVACAMNKHRYFNKHSAAKIGIAATSGLVSGITYKFKKVQLEQRIEKFISVREKLDQESTELHSKYEINDKIIPLFKQILETNEEIKQLLANKSDSFSEKNLNQLRQKYKQLYTEIDSLFKEKNLSFKQFIMDGKKIGALEEKNLAEYIVTIDEYRLNDGKLDKLTDDLYLTYIYGKAGQSQNWIKMLIMTDESIANHLQHLIKQKTLFEHLLELDEEELKEMAEELGQLILDMHNLHIRFIENPALPEEFNRYASTFFPSHAWIIEFLKDIDAKIHTLQDFSEENAFSRDAIENYFSTSRYFRIEDNSGKLTDKAIKTTHAELSKKLANFAVDQQLNDVLDPDQEAALRKKYLELKQVYKQAYEDETEEGIYRISILYQEFWSMKGAALFHSQLPEADKIQNLFNSHVHDKTNATTLSR